MFNSLVYLLIITLIINKISQNNGFPRKDVQNLLNSQRTYSFHKLQSTIQKDPTTTTTDTIKPTKFPIKIKDVVTRLTQSTQLSLQQKHSRFEIQLPPSLDLGLNERSSSIKDNETTRTNREIAKLFLEMFGMLKDTSVVIFPTEQEAKVAKEIWEKKQFQRQIFSFFERFDIKSLSKTERKAYDEKRMKEANFNPDDYLTIKPNIPKGTELIVIISPQPKDYSSILSLHQEFGFGTLILLINPRFVWNELMEKKFNNANANDLSTSTTTSVPSSAQPNLNEESNKDNNNRSSFYRKKKNRKEDSASVEPAPQPTTNQLSKDFQHMIEVSSQFPNSFYYSAPVLANQKLMKEITKNRQILLFHESIESQWYLIEKLTETTQSNPPNSNNPMNALAAMMTNLVDKLDESKSVKVLLSKPTKPTEEEIIQALKVTEN